MSVTSQLSHSALGAWCAAALTGAPALVDQAQAAGRGCEPVRPTGDVNATRWDTAGVHHWATIGGAFGQRLAFLVAHEPPYAAYLGAANAGLLGGAMLDTVVNRWPAHRPLGVGELPDQPGMADDLIDAFTVRLVDHLATHAPPGTLADTRDAANVLACACWVLTGWEAAYRGGAILPSLSYMTEDLSSMPSQGSGDLAVDALLTEAPSITYWSW